MRFLVFHDEGIAAVRPLGYFGEASRKVGLLRFRAFGTLRPFPYLIDFTSNPTCGFTAALGTY